MTAQIHKFPPSKRDLDLATFRSVAAACASIEAIYPAFRMMRQAAELLEEANGPIRADARTMISRLAATLHEIEASIIASRTTARYCAQQLKELGQ